MAKLKGKNKTGKTNGLSGPSMGIGARLEVSEGASGNEVNIVVDFDISPLDFNLDYDAINNELSGSVELGLPGDLIGITGGISVDAETGELNGITGGISFAGLEIEIEKGVGKYKCRTVSTITYFGVGYSVVQDNCTEKKVKEEEEDNQVVFIPPPLPSSIPFPNLDADLFFISAGTPCSWLSPRTWTYHDGTNTSNPTWACTRALSTGDTIDCGESTNSPTPVSCFVPRENDNPGDAYEGKYFLWVKDSGFQLSISSPGSGWRKVCGVQWFRDYVDVPPGIGNVYNRNLEVVFAVSNKGDWDLVNNIIINSYDTLQHSYMEDGEIVTYDVPFCFFGSSYPRTKPIISFKGALKNCAIVPIPEPEPEPEPRRKPNYRPIPHKKKKDPMTDDCCLAILDLLIKQCNVTGIAEEYQYPIPIEKGEEVVETLHLIDYLKNKQEQSSLINLLGTVPNEPIFPLEVELQNNLTDKKPAKLKLNNIIELLQLVGDSIGYSQNFGVKLKLSGDNREFSYANLSLAVADLLKVIAPHKLLYGNEDEGYAVPADQLFPGADGYDFTKDYAGIATRQLSAIQRYGFDAPLYVKVKDANPAIKGDQEVGLEFENLAGAIEKLVSLAVDNAGDIDAQTNILVRLGYLLTRCYQVLTRIFYRVTAILDGLGIPTKNKKTTVPVEFNPFAGQQFEKGKGFGEVTQANEQIDFKDEDNTEKILPEFLQVSELDEVVDEKVKSPTLLELINQLVNRKQK